MQGVFFARESLLKVMRKIRATGSEISVDSYAKSGYIIASSMDSAIFMLNQDRQGSNAILIVFCDKYERKRIKKLRPFTHKSSLSAPLKKVKFSVSKNAYLSDLIKETLALDLVSLMQSALYTASPKQRRKKCRTALIEWVKSPDTPINDFLVAQKYNPLPKDISSKFEKWRQGDRPDIKKFLLAAKGKNKAQIISLGEKFGLSSFESITLSQWD